MKKPSPVLLFALIAGACTMPTPPAPAPPSPPAPVPFPPGQVCDSGHPNNNATHCWLDVTVIGGHATVSKKTVTVQEPPPDLHIVWKVTGPYWFVDGDVALVNPNGFNTPCATDDPNGDKCPAVGGQRHKMYHWIAHNPSLGSTNYTIRIRDNDNHVITVDPTIVIQGKVPPPP